MRCRRHEFIAGALFGLCLGLPLSVSAEPAAATTPRDPAAAEALFDEGRRALEKNDLETACAKFAESQRLDPGVGTLMNWASCEERQGRIATAWQRWREAVDQLPVDDERLGFATKRAALLEPRLPRLSITLRQRAPRESRVMRDDVALGQASLGTLLPVDPGEHRITVRAPGFEPRAFTLVIDEGEKKSIEVEPGKALPQRTQVDGEARKQSNTRTVGWALIGAGGAGVMTGIVTGLLLPAKQDEVDANCSAEGCNQAGVDAASEGKTLLVVNAVGWGAGIAALGAGTYFVLSSKSEPVSTRDTRARRRSPSVGVLHVPSGLGLTYRSGF
jgi:hypothetical protein